MSQFRHAFTVSLLNPKEQRIIQCLPANDSNQTSVKLSPNYDIENPMDHHEFSFPDEHGFTDAYFIIKGQETCKDAAELLTDAISFLFGQELLTVTREASKEELGEYRYSMPDSELTENVSISVWNQTAEEQAEVIAGEVLHYLQANNPDIEHHERFSTRRENK